MSWPSMHPSEDVAVLCGIRVLDFSNLLPGPYCTQILADLGADVIKIESPAGDPARQLRDGIYETANRNKRSAIADLKTVEGRNACLRLAESADVVVEGFRPGVASRLGVGYEDVVRLNPAVVYCSISGYGQTGPWRAKGGHDLTFLASSGALSFSPHWGERPRRSGVPVADLAASTFAAISILASLRDRDRTGQGCHLDVAIADAALAFISPRSGPNFYLQNEDRRCAYPTNDLFETADGNLLAVSAVEPQFWERLRDTLTRYAPELADRRFDDSSGRHRHGDHLKELLTRVFRGKSAEEWLSIFADVDVAIEPVLTVAEAAHNVQTTARGIVQRCHNEEQVVFPVLCNGQPLARFRRPAPQHGADTEAVLDSSDD